MAGEETYFIKTRGLSHHKPQNRATMATETTNQRPNRNEGDMMRTCELVLYSVGKGGNGRYPICGKIATYYWTPRHNPNRGGYYCKEHGEGMAGNFKDELTLLKSTPNTERKAI